MINTEAFSITNTELKARGISPFAATQITTRLAHGNLCILDLPCGFGRHSHLLADMGNHVVAADLDAKRVEETKKFQPQSTAGVISGIVIDAYKNIPFKPNSFDAILMTDFVARNFFLSLSEILKPGGWFFYQTMGNRGANWRTLPRIDDTLAQLPSNFSIIEFHYLFFPYIV